MWRAWKPRSTAVLTSPPGWRIDESPKSTKRAKEGAERGFKSVLGKPKPKNASR